MVVLGPFTNTIAKSRIPAMVSIRQKPRSKANLAIRHRQLSERLGDEFYQFVLPMDAGFGVNTLHCPTDSVH